MNLKPVCQECGRTWKNMYDLAASLRTGEIDVMGWHATRYGINAKIQHFYIEDNQRKKCKSGEIQIPLVTDIFNNNLECIIVRDKRDDPRVYMSVSGLAELD